MILPPLPKFSPTFTPRWPGDEGGFTADQMREYGAACAAAEREQCANLCKAYAERHTKTDDNTKAQSWMMLMCAAEISRRGEKP